MQNPFLNRNFINIYVIAWAVIIVIQFLFSFLIFKHDPLSSALQSFFSNAIFATLGFGIWPVVKFNNPGKGRYSLQTLFKIFLAGIFVIFVWIVSSFVIDNLLFKISSGSINFQRHPLLQFISGCFLYIILILIYYVLILFSQYAEKSLSEERLENLLTETKLNALKAYINPHFLFNSLNSVNALISINPEKAREMLINLSDYFRYSLKQKDNTFVDFKNELYNALTYFEIEKLRFGDRVTLKMDIDENTYPVKVPVMILQPLFENIIKHAVSESFDIINIDFIAKVHNETLIVSLINNYDKDAISHKGTGIGLSTNYERFYLMYNRKDLIDVSKIDGIFKVVLKIPINQNS